MGDGPFSGRELMLPGCVVEWHPRTGGTCLVVILCPEACTHSIVQFLAHDQAAILRLPERCLASGIAEACCNMHCLVTQCCSAFQ